MQSNSELKMMRTCALQHHWRYTERRGPFTSSVAAELGTQIHVYLANWYQSGTVPWSAGEEDKAGQLAREYITMIEQNNLNEGWEVLAVEMPMYNKDLAIKGVCDLMIRDLHGDLWLVDHKTSGKPASVLSRELLRSTQGIHYALLCPQAVGIIYQIFSTNRPDTAPVLVYQRIDGSAKDAYTTWLGEWRRAKAATPTAPNPGDACVYCVFAAPCMAKTLAEDWEMVLELEHTPGDPDARYRT